MRKLFSSKKRIAMAAGLLVVALSATAAFAFWTASGTGSGNATAGTDSGVSIISVGFSGSLYPAGSVNVRFAIRNDSANTPVQVDKVVADTSVYSNGVSVASAPNADTNHPCDPLWFTYTAGPELNVNIAASSSYLVHADGTGGSLAMSNPLDTNQDGCKGATLTLHLKTDNTAIGG